MTHFVRKTAFYSLAAALALAATQFAAPVARAAGYDIGSIHIAEPWARATPKSASSAAAYLTITNNGEKPDRVSCVSSDAAAECQIHTMTLDNGVMKMRPVEDGLKIEPGQTLLLKPSGLHLMLTGLKHPLEPGHAVEATLQFEKAGTVKVAFPIVALGAPAPGPLPSGGGGSMMMEGHGSMMQMDKH